MSQIKMNKHKVYGYLADNLEWFKGSNSLRYLSCYTIGAQINKELKKDCSGDPPFIKLSGSTLTAMVHDGVLVREYGDYAHCYTYCPVQPIKEEYKAN